MSTAASWPAVTDFAHAPSRAPRASAHWLIKGCQRLHERLLSRPTFAIARNLRQTECHTDSVIAAAQLASLRSLIHHAAKNCPYYAGRLQNPDIKSIDDLAALPLLIRHDLKDHFASMVATVAPASPVAPASRRCALLLGHTHGTLDEPLQFYWDRKRQAWDKANRLRGHAWHGFDIGDRELHLWPIDPPQDASGRWRQRLRKWRDALTGDVQIDSLSVFSNPSMILDAWRQWASFNPCRVTAYPSTLASFILEAQAMGRELSIPSLRAVFLTGEVTFDWQRRLIESALGVPTIQSYGLQEAGAIAFACEFGAWHVSAESALVEIIRDGRPAAEGELGEIVVTGLQSHAMPVIRYCTGDIARATDGAQPPSAVLVKANPTSTPAIAPLTRGTGVPRETCGTGVPRETCGTGVPRETCGTGVSPVVCPCGRSLPTMPEILGRAGDFLEAADGRWVSPADVVTALGEFLEPGYFQVRQDKHGAVRIDIVEAQNSRQYRPSMLTDCLQSLVGGRACVLHTIPALARSLYGKCRYVLSERTASGLATPDSHDVAPASRWCALPNGG